LRKRYIGGDELYGSVLDFVNPPANFSVPRSFHSVIAMVERGKQFFCQARSLLGWQGLCTRCEFGYEIGHG
jgi:hypothetical protein